MAEREPVTVAAALIVMVVPFVIPETVAPAGMPLPAMAWPTNNPAEEPSVTVVLPEVVLPLSTSVLGMPSVFAPEVKI